MTALDRIDLVPDALPADLGHSDEQLVDLLRQGARDEAMTAIHARYERRLFHFAMGIVRETHLAHDVVQEVMQRVLQKHALYRPGTNFRAWLFEIARNQALSMLRAQRRAPRPLSNLPADDDQGTDLLQAVPAPADERGLETGEFMAAFAHAVQALPPAYRTVFELCVQQGTPYQKAAELLGLPTGTVAIRIMRARKRLFAALAMHLDRLRRPPACFQQAG